MTKPKETWLTIVGLSADKIAQAHNAIVIVIENVEYVRKDIAIDIMKKFAKKSKKK